MTTVNTIGALNGATAVCKMWCWKAALMGQSTDHWCATDVEEARRKEPKQRSRWWLVLVRPTVQLCCGVVSSRCLVVWSSCGCVMSSCGRVMSCHCHVVLALRQPWDEQGTCCVDGCIGGSINNRRTVWLLLTGGVPTLGRTGDMWHWMDALVDRSTAVALFGYCRSCRPCTAPTLGRTGDVWHRMDGCIGGSINRCRIGAPTLG